MSSDTADWFADDGPPVDEHGYALWDDNDDAAEDSAGPGDLHIAEWAVLLPDAGDTPAFPDQQQAERYAAEHGGVAVGVTDNVIILEAGSDDEGTGHEAGADELTDHERELYQAWEAADAAYNREAAAERLADAWNAPEPDRAATDMYESEIAAEQALVIAEAEAESSHTAWLEAQRADAIARGDQATAQVVDKLIEGNSARTRGQEEDTVVDGPLAEDRTAVGGVTGSFNTTDEDQATIAAYIDRAEADYWADYWREDGYGSNGKGADETFAQLEDAADHGW